jgi:hypothetical protein
MTSEDHKQADDVASAATAITTAMQQLTEQSLAVSRQIVARQNASEFLLDGVLYAIVSNMPKRDRRRWLDGMHALAIEPVVALNTAQFASEREREEIRATVHMTHAIIAATLDQLATCLPGGEQTRRGK